MANEILVLRTSAVPSGSKSFELVYLSAISPPIHLQNDPALPKATPALLGTSGSSSIEPTALAMLEARVPGVTAAIDAGDVLVWFHTLEQGADETDAQTLAKARNIWNSNAVRRIQELRDTVEYFGRSFNA